MNTDVQEETFESQVDAVASGDDKDIKGVYEIGYHILPTVAEDALEAEVNKITDVLKKIDADFVGERFPAKVNLSYNIEKKVGNDKRSFDGAYFGWVAFETTPSELKKIEEALKLHENVLRYVIIKTSRDIVASTMADPGLDAGSPKREKEESVGEVSEKELDEALEHIETKEEV